jgi:hypothetical protein
MNNTMQSFLETVNFKITNGSVYHDFRFGTNAFILTSWDGKPENGRATIIFDTETQEVYRIEICDFAKRKAFAWETEWETDKSDDIAWDGVKLRVTDSLDDILEKVKAIMHGEPYDARVVMSLDISDAEFLLLAKAAHAVDVTINDFIVQAVTDAMVYNSKKVA